MTNKVEITVKKLMLTIAFLALLAAGAAQAGGDAAAGQAVFENVCAECHYEDDYSGKSQEEIAGMIQAILDGETEHEDQELKLTAEEVANVSAYFAAN
jgi:mono/diheme cytochrome c family protein